MYKVVTTKSFAKALSRLPVNWQRRIVEKIKEVATDPYATHNNVTRLQGRDGYRLRIGDWRVIYELHDDRLELWALEVGPREGFTDASRNHYAQGQGIRRDSGGGSQKLMEDAEMLADVKAYDAAKARLERARTNSSLWRSPSAG